jgi:trans-aconitate methyltransferase
LLALLAPKTGERILDVGCGTGQLTAEIARSGAEAVGIDNSPAMITEARRNFPKQHFEVADVTAMRYHAEFDAVFSNAALHWVRGAARGVSAAGGGLRRAAIVAGREVVGGLSEVASDGAEGSIGPFP